MVKTSIPKANVERDFLNVIRHRMKKKYAAQLLKKWKSGKLKFTVSKTLKKKDGETSFLPINGKGPKKSIVTIKRKVAMSKHVCWRMSILLHELAHVLHHFNTKGRIPKNETHGKDWMIKVDFLFCRFCREMITPTQSPITLWSLLSSRKKFDCCLTPTIREHPVLDLNTSAVSSMVSWWVFFCSG